MNFADLLNGLAYVPGLFERFIFPSNRFLYLELGVETSPWASVNRPPSFTLYESAPHE